MPQGVVVAVRPGLTPEPCSGTIRALADDPKMGIVKGQEYEFTAGRGKCCDVNNTVEIQRKKKDGTVKLDCSEEMEEQNEPQGST